MLNRGDSRMGKTGLRAFSSSDYVTHPRLEGGQLALLFGTPFLVPPNPGLSSGAEPSLRQVNSFLQILQKRYQPRAIKEDEFFLRRPADLSKLRAGFIGSRQLHAMAAGRDLESHGPLVGLHAIGLLANRWHRTLHAIVDQPQWPLTRSR